MATPNCPAFVSHGITSILTLILKERPEGFPGSRRGAGMQVSITLQMVLMSENIEYRLK
jgi:hypothetical protein